MAPKKKKGKKEAEVAEPPHDPSWERAVVGGVWERSVDALPGAPPGTHQREREALLV